MILVPWKSGLVDVPKAVATCPTCKGELLLHVLAWEAASGKPNGDGNELTCAGEEVGCPLITSYQELIELHDVVDAWALEHVRVTG